MEFTPEFYGRRVWCVGLHISLGSLIYGYNLGVMSPSYKEICRVLDVSPDNGFVIGMLSSSLLLGAAVGSLFAGSLTQKIGRRRTILLADLMVILGSLISIIPFVPSFVCGRIVVGVACGVFAAICPIYLGESSPPLIRGKVGTLMQTSLTLGLVFAYVLGVPLPLEATESEMQHWWMCMLLFPALVAIYMVFMFTCVYTYDTPYWLSSNGFKEQCRASLEYFYTAKGVEDANESLRSHVSLSQTASFSATLTLRNLLCGQKYRKMMRLGCLLNLVKQFSGNSSILFYSAFILTQGGGSEMDARVYSVVIGLANLVFALLAIGMISKFGRKQLIVSGEFILGLDLLMLGVYMEFIGGPVYVIVILVSLFMCIFQYSLGSILWVYCGEVMNEKGLALANTVGMVANFVVVLAFPIAESFIGLGYTFLIHAGILLVSGLYSQWDVFETRNLSRVEISKTVQNADDTDMQQF